MRRRPSEFRSKVTFLRKQLTRTDQGGFIPVDKGYLVAWARVSAISGRESFVGDQLRGMVDFQIYTRKNPDVRATDRVTLPDGRILDVQAVLQDDEEPRFMRVLAGQKREATQGEELAPMGT